MVLKRYHLLFRDAAMLRKRLQDERKNLRARIDKRTIRVSKCAETYIEFFNLHHEYDSFLVAAEPSNPWVSDSTEFWEMFGGGGGGGGGLHGILGRVPKEPQEHQRRRYLYRRLFNDTLEQNSNSGGIELRGGRAQCHAEGGQ